MKRMPLMPGMVGHYGITWESPKQPVCSAAPAPRLMVRSLFTAYSSGEIVALRLENGRVVWSDSLTALRRTDPVSTLAHIRGRPVIDRGRVVASSNSGRTVAIDLRTGSRLWEQGFGSTYGAWVAGEFIYLMSTNGEIVCLARLNGGIRWVRQLQRFEDEEDKEKPIFWSGPGARRRQDFGWWLTWRTLVYIALYGQSARPR